MDFLTVLFGIVVGTIIFVALHKVFDIYHFGFKGMASMWAGCFFAALVILAVFIKIIGGVFGFLGTVIVLLIKLSLICLMVYGVYYGYKKITGAKQDTTKSE